MRSLISLSLAIGAAMLATFHTAHARVTKITVTHTESPTFEGRSFGTVGQYEKLVGRVVGELEPIRTIRLSRISRSRGATPGGKLSMKPTS
jgi:hypothetical protein